MASLVLPGTLFMLAASAQAPDSARLLVYESAGPRTTPAYIRDHLGFLESRPFDGMVVGAPVSYSILASSPVDTAWLGRTLAPYAGLRFTRLRHNLILLATPRFPDLFASWDTVLDNVRRFGAAAGVLGFEGVFFDDEAGSGAVWGYPENVADRSRSLAEYSAQAELRGRQVMAALESGFPGLTLIMSHGPFRSCRSTPAVVLAGQSGAHGWELMGPFLAGMIEAAGPGVGLVDAGEVYGYRTANDYETSYRWRREGMAADSTACPFIPTALRSTWASRLGIGFMLYNKPYPPGRGLVMNPAVMTGVLPLALRRADRYVILYFEDATWLAPGGVTPDWEAAVRAGRRAAGR
jgi:hypothetical protein